MDDEVDETPASGHGGGTPRWHNKPKAATPASLVGRDCEIRLAGGAVHRGELVAAGGPWLTLAMHHGRTAIVAKDAVVSIVDEGAGGR